MIEALKKLAMVSFAVLICLFASWLYLRNKGLSTPLVEALRHPFLTQEFPTLVAYTPVERSHFPIHKVDLEGWQNLPTSTVLWIPVESSFEGELFIRPLSGTSQDAKIPLAEVFQRFPKHKMILNFLDNRPDHIEKIMAAIELHQVADQVLIQSPIDRLLRDLREKRPLWVYGTSRRQATLVQMLNSIGLESMAPMRGDVFVYENIPGAAEEIPDRVAQEARRRGLRVFAGPARNREEVRRLLDKGVDGVLTLDPIAAGAETNR